MLQKTLLVQGPFSASIITNTMIGKEQSVPTIKVTPIVTETTGTQEKSLENGLDDSQKAILATYDRIGKFDLKKLEVKTLETGLKILDKNKFLTKGQGRLVTIGAHTSHGKSALLM